MKFLDLTAQHQSIKKEIDNAIKQVLDKGIFIGGEEIEKFEKEITKFCRVKYAIGVNSGTDALYLSLKALGIGSGDEVITTPFTFIATAEAIANLGAKPIFCDINPETLNIDSSKIEEKITKKTKAILPVHLFGKMAEMNEIMRIAKKYKLFVVEDAAQAIGAEHKKRKAGSMGSLGCLSFFPSKNLGCYGDGGMIVTGNKKLADEIRLLKNHGSSTKEKYLNLILGTNSRLDALQATILRVKLKHLKKWNKKRAENAKYYSEKLRRVEDIVVPSADSDQTHVFNQYTLRTKHRNQLRKYLKEKGIPTMVYYSIPLHLQPCFKYLRYKKGNFPEAEKAAKEVLSLPIYPEITKREQNYIVEKTKEFYEFSL